MPSCSQPSEATLCFSDFFLQSLPLVLYIAACLEVCGRDVHISFVFDYVRTIWIKGSWLSPVLSLSLSFPNLRCSAIYVNIFSAQRTADGFTYDIGRCSSVCQNA